MGLLRAAGALPAAVYGQNGTHDGQRDFDFEIGAWQATVCRPQRPLSGSKDWVEYRGTSVVRQVWDGDANLGPDRAGVLHRRGPQLGAELGREIHARRLITNVRIRRSTHCRENWR